MSIQNIQLIVGEFNVAVGNGGNTSEVGCVCVYFDYHGKIWCDSLYRRCLTTNNNCISRTRSKFGSSNRPTSWTELNPSVVGNNQILRQHLNGFCHFSRKAFIMPLSTHELLTFKRGEFFRVILRGPSPAGALSMDISGIYRGSYSHNDAAMHDWFREIFKKNHTGSFFGVTPFDESYRDSDFALEISSSDLSHYPCTSPDAIKIVRRELIESNGDFRVIIWIFDNIVPDSDTYASPTTRIFSVFTLYPLIFPEFSRVRLTLHYEECQHNLPRLRTH